MARWVASWTRASARSSRASWCCEMLHTRNATPRSASNSATPKATLRRTNEDRFGSATRRLPKARERAPGRVGRGAHRRGLRLEVGERGVAGRLERRGEVGGPCVVVLVNGLVGDVDRVVAGIDLRLLGREERGKRL